jgi:RNA polymerase sigma-70 factor, ECF subfamily
MLAHMSHASIAAELLAALAPAAHAEVVDHLDGLVGSLVAAAARWPEAQALNRGFVSYLGERLSSRPALTAALPRLRLEDLVLAWWAGRGEPDGIAAFEHHFADDLARIAARFSRLHGGPDELRQELRIKLFVGGARRPKISDYDGFGFLQNWLRVTAVRAFVDVSRRQHAQRLDQLLDERDLLGAVDPGASPAQRQMRTELAAALKQAFATAVTELPTRSRNFLRHQLVDRMTLDEIAALYRVHRATVARVLAATRTNLLAATRAQLTAKLGIDHGDLAAVITGLDSQLDLSLSKVLAVAGPQGSDDE